jgi:hypothetical protein
MTLPGKNHRIRFPKIGITHGTLAINPGERIPQLLSGLRRTISSGNTYNFLAVPVKG